MSSIRPLWILLTLSTALLVACGDSDNPLKTKETPQPNRISMSRPSWTQASAPVQLPSSAVKAKLLWHQPSTLPRSDEVYPPSLFPERPGSSSVLQTLRLVFRPVDAPSPVDQWLTSKGVTPPTRVPAHAPSWAGIMKAQTFDFTEDSRYFTVRLKSTNVRVHFEFGRFREDLDGDGYLTTEDVNGNDFVDPEEDIGLDGLADNVEPGFNPSNNVDPNGDNWFFQGHGTSPVPIALVDDLTHEMDVGHPLFHEWLNGTEGNRNDLAMGGEPDDEMLGTTPVITDDYFSYVITPGTAPDPFHVPALDNAGWRTHRIPLRDLNAIDTVIGSPLWNTVQYVRVWLDADADATAENVVEIAGWSFTED